MTKAGGEVASRHRTKHSGVKAGCEMARDNKGEHAIHNKDGQFSRKNSYGRDPNPPRDKDQ